MAEDKMVKAWQKFQDITGYTDEEMAIFKANPRFMKMMATPAFRTHKIIVDVVESHGCICQHKVGQRIVISGNGALVSAECPPIMCLGLVNQLYPVAVAVFERFAADLDPNGLLFDSIGCSDVGVKCGGWGRVLVKIHVEGPEKK
ncbi:MAG: hypothetical protein PHR43_01075 [Dehalococcoidales bacterium]|nr:hypothetical protein [Dehalococcoidales bacterium]